MTKNVTITGASGFIGSHLMKKINAKALKHEDIVQGHSYGAEKAFFMSTYGNMALHSNTHEIVRANVTRLLYILNGLYGWFCYMSSSSVMLAVQTPYSRAKRAAEEILQALEIQYCIVRPYTVIGVGDQKEHLIPTLIRSCFTGEPMKLSLKAVHDYVDVEDVVNGLVQFAEMKAVGIFELGSGVPTSNGMVWKLVEEITGKKANVEIVDQFREYDNLDWYCKNPAKGWKPTKPLSTSIEEMMKAYEHSTGMS